MRKESEKKSKVTSIRFSEEQYKTVQSKAKENSMTVSSYIVNIAVHGSSMLKPQDMVQIQNIVNTAYGIAKEFAPEKAEQMESEVNKLWSQLK